MGSLRCASELNLDRGPAWSFDETMANCYICGRKIENGRHLRRRVKTGEWLRRRYPKTSVSHFQITYGMRITCKWCIRQIDRSEWRAAVIGHLTVVFALVGLMLALLITTSARN